MMQKNYTRLEILP